MARRMPFLNLGLLSGAGLEEIPMMLPGLVRDALEEVGVLDDPELGLDSLSSEWVALRPWQITAEVSLEGFTDERAFLELWGLCGEGSIRIGGEEVAVFHGGNLTVEVTKFIFPDQELLQVQLDFAPSLPEGLPPMPAVGIIGGLWLRGVTFLSIQALHVRPDLRSGQLFVKSAVEAYTRGEYQFTYALMQEDELLSQQVVTEELSAGPGQLSHEIQVRAPALWVAGAENTLYTLRLTVTRQGMGCDRTQQRVGFRTLGVEQTQVEGREMLSEINARRVFLRGALWQRPTWQMRNEEQLSSLLDLVQRAHINCLKVCQVETEAFYDACDRRGLLVWQELPFAVEDARMVIGQLGYHASIVLWSLPPLEVAENRPAPLLDARVKPIADLLDNLGDERPFLGVVPGGPIARATMEELGRELCFCVEGPDVYHGAEWLARYFNRDDALLRTMSPAALVRMSRMLVLSGGHSPWPPGGVLWAHRGGTAPELDPTDAQDWLGQNVTGDAMQMVRLSRFWQAQMLRYAAQRARARQATGFFAGQFNERFATLGSPALVEFDGSTRPAYHALASAFSPICLCARMDRLAFWADTPADVFIEMMVDEDAADPGAQIEIIAECYTHAGKRFFGQKWPATLTSTRLPVQQIPMPDFPGIVLLRLEALKGKATICREDIILCVGLRAMESALISPPMTMLTVEAGFLLNAGESLAFGVRCDGYEETWMPGWGALLPGEFHPIAEDCAIEGHNVQLLPRAQVTGGEGHRS